MSEDGLKDQIIIKFAQKLASNESKLRNRSVKKLRNWLSSKSKVGGGFTERELLKLWKGLHYCMWMCDKPLVQQDLSESLSKLLHVFVKVEFALNFFSAFLKTQAREWFTTDRLRLDKFMMLIRMSVHEVFVLLQNHEWQPAHIKQLNSILTADLFPRQSDQVPDGLKYHIINLYLEELAKVGLSELVGSVLLDLVEPFMTVILVTNSASLQRYIVKHFFDEILKQAKKKLTEEQDKAALHGDPVETEENDKDDSKALQFDCEALGNRLFELASKESCPGRNRKSVYALVKRFKTFSEGIVEQPTPKEGEELSEAEEERALKKLVKFEDNIVLKERKRKTEKKKRKKQKLKEGTEEEDQEQPVPKKRKLDVQPGKKSKNKFKDQDTSVVKKGEQSKTNREPSGHDSHQESSLCSTGDFLFEGEFESDEDTQSTGDELNISISSQEDQCVPSIVQVDETRKETRSSQKKGVRSQRTIQSSTDSGAIFAGGFVSSSDDEGNQTAPNMKQVCVDKKRKKKRKGSAEIEIDCIGLESSDCVEVADEQSHESVEDLLALPSDCISSQKERKGKALRETDKASSSDKRGKHKVATGKNSSGNRNGCMAKEGSVSSSGKKYKKKSETNSDERKKKRSINDSHMEDGDTCVVGKGDDDVVEEESMVKECGSDGEVEIYIPNKKYKGKYKEWSLKQAALTLGADSQSPTTSGSKLHRGLSSAEKKKSKAANKASSPKTGAAFATFDKLLQTPPAFVKKSVLKSTSPKTDPRHNKKNKGDEENAVLSEGKRRVSFGLHRNEMQSTKDYNDALKKTPDVPFNPSALPETSILKANNTPKSAHVKGRKHRPKAADFF